MGLLWLSSLARQGKHGVENSNKVARLHLQSASREVKVDQPSAHFFYSLNLKPQATEWWCSH